MKLLVTGGAGFIGSNFIYYIQKKHPDYRIVCLDALTYAGNLKTLAHALKEPNFKFVRGDIADREWMFRVFRWEGFDGVVNFAAESHVDRSIHDPSVFLQTNVIGTQTLMDAAQAYGVKRFHQVSTDEVYGELSLDRRDLLFTEQTALRASSPYSASKAAADLLALAYHRTYGLPVTLSRCSNNYGPYHFPEKMIPLMIINGLRGKRLPVYGDGKNVRDWLYVEDHCAAIEAILHRGKIGEVYNIGANNEWANIDVVRMLLKHLGRSEDLIDYVEDRAGHDLRYGIDASKIQQELGWKPRMSFEEGIEKTVRWYVENQEWWEGMIAPSQSA